VPIDAYVWRDFRFEVFFLYICIYNSSDNRQQQQQNTPFRACGLPREEAAKRAGLPPPREAQSLALGIKPHQRFQHQFTWLPGAALGDAIADTDAHARGGGDVAEAAAQRAAADGRARERAAREAEAKAADAKVLAALPVAHRRR